MSDIDLRRLAKALETVGYSDIQYLLGQDGQGWSAVARHLAATSAGASLLAEAAVGAAVRPLWDAPHIVTFTEDAYGLQHPLRCRPNLIVCRYQEWLASRLGPAQDPGRYFMAMTNDDSEPVFDLAPADYDDGFAAIAEALGDE